MSIEEGSKIPFPPVDLVYSEEPSVTEENSIIANTPELARILDALHRFNKSPTNEEKSRQVGREKFGKEVIHELMDYARNDPGRIFNLIESAHLLLGLESYKVEKFLAQIKIEVEKIILPLNSVIIGQWFETWVENPLHRELAEKVLLNNFSKRTNQRAVVDFIYQFCLGCLTSGNPKVREEALKVMSLQTQFLPGYHKETDEGINLQTRYVFEGIFSKDDDIVHKSFEIDQAYYHVAMMDNPELLEARKEDSSDILRTTMLAQDDRDGGNEIKGGRPNTYWGDYQRIRRQYPGFRIGTNSQGAIVYDIKEARSILSEDDFTLLEKFSQLAKFYSTPNNKLVARTKQIDHKKFPYNLVSRPGELGQWTNDSLAQQLNSNEKEVPHLVLRLPDFEVVISSEIERVSQLILEKITAVGADIEETTNANDEKYWRTLFHLLPIELYQNPENLQALTKVCDEMAKEICEQALYSLSPRGDQTVIQDEKINNLGFSSVAYDIFEENKKWTVANVPVGNYNFRLLIDEYGNFRHYESHATLNFSGIATFLRYIILSYLREIKCSERVITPTKGKSKDGTREGFTERRGHTRRLQKGQKPSPAMELSARENGIDLSRINELLRQNREDFLKTFIPPTEVALSGKGRIICIAPEAMNKYEETLKMS